MPQQTLGTLSQLPTALEQTVLVDPVPPTPQVRGVEQQPAAT